MKLTIFTPVYNRANLINNLYESLTRQSNTDFIWMIVDDGSTDNIKQIIEQYKKTSNFKIQYIYQDNRGKHSAHNTGIANCSTELFLCVDSDDYLTDDAVEKIYAINREYGLQEQCVLGYFFRKKDTKNQLSGGNFNLKNKLVGLREIYFKYGFSGELAIVFKTELIKDYHFPTYDSEKFVSEKVFYNQITNIAPMVYVDDAIYIFEYQQSGYTMNANSLLAKNPVGTAMGYLSDTIYGTKFIDRAKSYSSFIAMKQVFCIPNNQYDDYNIPFAIRCAGWILKPHYIKIFKKINIRYNLEVI